MKAILCLAGCLVFPLILCAQTKKQRKLQVPEKFDQLEIAPEAKLQLSDSLAFADTLQKMPEAFVLPEMTRPGKDREPYRMPVVRPQGNDVFNMPIYVPDSSVHYYIKNAKPDWPEPKKK